MTPDTTPPPWSELRPPGCTCRTLYERDQCCEACEPAPQLRPAQWTISTRTSILVILSGLVIWVAVLYYFVELLRGAISNYPG